MFLECRACQRIFKVDNLSEYQEDMARDGRFGGNCPHCGNNYGSNDATNWRPMVTLYDQLVLKRESERPEGYTVTQISVWLVKEISTVGLTLENTYTGYESLTSWDNIREQYAEGILSELED